MLSRTLMFIYVFLSYSSGSSYSGESFQISSDGIKTKKTKIIENENGFLSSKDGHLLFLDPLLLLQGPPVPRTEASGSELLQVPSKEMVPAGSSAPGT